MIIPPQIKSISRMCFVGNYQIKIRRRVRDEPPLYDLVILLLY